MNDKETTHELVNLTEEPLRTYFTNDLYTDRGYMNCFFVGPTVLAYCHSPGNYCYWFNNNYYMCTYDWQLPDFPEIVAFEDLSPEQQAQMARIVLEAEERYAV